MKREQTLENWQVKHTVSKWEQMKIVNNSFVAYSTVACQKPKNGQRINEKYTANLTTSSSLLKQFPSLALR